MASANSVGCGCNVTTTPPLTRAPEPQAPATTAPAAPAASTVSTNAVKDKVDVKDAKPANTTEVKADGWKKGKNDCIEHMLVNSGYSLKEIYTKDASGKTLAQRVAADNGLKDPNLVRTGQTINIPKKGEAADGGLKKGETSEARAGNEDRSITKTAQRTDDGKQMTTRVQNDGASLEQTTTVGDKGRIDGSVSRNGDYVRGREVARNGAGDAITESTTVAGPEGTRTRIADRDATPNMRVHVDGSTIVAENPGAKDGVRTEVRDAPQGIFERLGSWGDNVGRWITGNERSSEELNVSNARSVVEQRNADGSREVRVTTADGTVQTHTRQADSQAQVNGRWVDNRLSDFGSWVTGLFTN